MCYVNICLALLERFETVFMVLVIHCVSCKYSVKRPRVFMSENGSMRKFPLML